MEESELLRLLQRGDPAGLEALIVRYTPYVSAVAARILPGCPREWEEVAADVFWAAWQELFPLLLQGPWWYQHTCHPQQRPERNHCPDGR